MLPDFNRLKVFYYIYKTGSSTEAGKLLHITQSGVSQHLKKLEEELQTQLFIRDKRKLVPSSGGHRFFTIIEKFVMELESTIGNFELLPLHIGAPIEFGKNYFSGLFASFLKTEADATLHMDIGSPQKLFRKISEGDLDFAYIDILPFAIETPKGISSYKIKPMIQEEFKLIASPDYYHKYIKKEDFNTLENLNYISYQPDTSLFKSWFKEQYNKAPENMNVIYSMDSVQGIVKAVKDGLGLGLVVSHLIQKELSSGELIAIKGNGKHLYNTIALVQLKNKINTSLELSFQKHIIKELQRIPELHLV